MRYFPYRGSNDAAYRVAYYNKKDRLYVICDKLRRPISFRSFDGAQRRADERNKAWEAAEAAKKVERDVTDPT